MAEGGRSEGKSGCVQGGKGGGEILHGRESLTRLYRRKGVVYKPCTAHDVLKETRLFDAQVGHI